MGASGPWIQFKAACWIQTCARCAVCTSIHYYESEPPEVIIIETKPMVGSRLPGAQTCKPIDA